MKKRILKREFSKRRRTSSGKVFVPSDCDCEQKLLEQASASFNQGFDSGYDEAWMRAMQTIPMMQTVPVVESVPDKVVHESSDNEYKKGLYDGGEGIVDSILPELEILPGISVRKIIEVGMKQMSSHYYRLFGATEVAEMIRSALKKRSPLSVIRLGDGELLTLAQEVVMSEEEVRKEGHFLSYSGVNLPDLAARDMLAAAIRKADIVGIPKLRLSNFQPLAFSVLKAHRIDYRNLKLTLSTINYALHLEGFIRGILAGYRVLIVGNSAPGLSKVLEDNGVRVTGVVTPVDGIRDIQRVMHEISDAREFDIALVGAGIPAVIIVQRIASELGKVALDFGHLADSLAQGESVL
ncbi:MAG: GT-D fold domain-containing glycosyltransferase [Bacillota bacterium]